MKFENIRKNILEYTTNLGPDLDFAIKNSLNWYRYEKHVRLLANKIPKNSKVLEMGCGFGHTVAMLSHLRPDLEIVGQDIYNHKKSWKKFKGKRVRFLKCNGIKTTFKKEYFDSIVQFGVLEHVENDTKFLKEIYRILKPRGSVYIFDLPNKFSFSEGFLMKIFMKINNKKFNLNCIEHTSHFHDITYTKNIIRKKMRETGFNNIKIRNEYLIPAQVGRISKGLELIFNKIYKLLDKIDYLLIRTPLGILSQSFMIECRK